MISISFSLLVICILLNFAIGFLIFWRDRADRTKQYFFLFTLFLGIWVQTNFFENEPYIGDYSLLFLQTDFAAAILASAFFYLFCLNFPQKKLEKKLGLEMAIYLFSIFFVVVSFTDLVIKDAFYSNGLIDVVRGFFFWPYFFFIFFLLGAGLVNLVAKYHKASGIDKVQIFYVLLGLLISSSAIFFINLVMGFFVSLPLEIYRIGTFSVFAISILTGFAITKYHLFSIRLIVTEMLVVLMGILLLGDVFDAYTFDQFIWKLVIFILFLIFGYNLIKATNKESKRREEAENIAAEESRLRVEAEKLANDLKRLNEAKTEFMLSAEHNLRLPLSVIKGYMDLLYGGSFGEINENAKKRIGSSMEVAEKLIKTVDDILDVAKYQMGKGEFMKEKIRIDALLREVADEFQSLAENKGLYLKLEEPKVVLPELMLDSRRLKSGLCNIIDNAIRYTGKGGITMEAGLSEDSVTISITDTGIGMDEEERSGLFSKTFERGKRAQNVHEGGKGISMYLTSQIVASQGGKVRVESEGRDKGSKFIITIPIKQNER